MITQRITGAITEDTTPRVTGEFKKASAKGKSFVLQTNDPCRILLSGLGGNTDKLLLSVGGFANNITKAVSEKPTANITVRV